MNIRREFDLPIDEVESEVAQGLMEAGLLEVIEPGDAVVGVALTIDARDYEGVLLLARSCGLDETILDDEIYGLVAELAPFYRDRPVLDRFRKLPPPESRGDTDEVVDLEMETVTDR